MFRTKLEFPQTADTAAEEQRPRFSSVKKPKQEPSLAFPQPHKSLDAAPIKIEKVSLASTLGGEDELRRLVSTKMPEILRGVDLYLRPYLPACSVHPTLEATDARKLERLAELEVAGKDDG